MIEIMIGLAPFVALMMGSMLTMGTAKAEGIARKITYFALAFALMVNSFLLIYLPEGLEISSLSISLSSLWINEIQLIGLFLIAVNLKTYLHQTHTAELLDATFLLFGAAMLGIFLSDNLMIITIFLMLALISLGAGFFFGDYVKKIESLQKFMLASVIAIGILVVVMIDLQISIDSLSLSDLYANASLLSTNNAYFILLGLVFGIGLVVGLIPALMIFKDYFLESNFINLRMFVSIFTPSLGLLLFKIISLFTPLYGGFGSVMFIISMGAIIVGTIILILETLGYFHERTKSIPKILGTFAIVETQMFVLFASIQSLSGLIPISNFLLIIQNIFVLACFGKPLLLESLTPILVDSREKDLQNLGGYHRHYPKMMIFLIITLILYIFPGLMGSKIISGVLPYLSNPVSDSPIVNIQLQFSLVLILIYFLNIVIIVATFINEIFYGKDATQKEVVARMKRIYYYIPIVFITGVILFTYLTQFSIISFFNP